MSEADKVVLEKIMEMGEKGENTPLDSEKEFFVQELRRIHGDENIKPRRREITAIIEKGRSANPPKLIRRALLNEQQYYGVVDRFFNKFIAVASKLAQK